MTDVTDACDLGLFYHIAKHSEPMDIIACPQQWSRCSITAESWARVEDEYGEDEPFLPPFHVVKIFTNYGHEGGKPSDIWDKFFTIGDDIKGLSPSRFLSSTKPVVGRETTKWPNGSAIVVGRGNLTHLPANLLHGCLRLLGSALPLVSMHEVSGRCRTRDAV